MKRLILISVTIMLVITMSSCNIENGTTEINGKINAGKNSEYISSGIVKGGQFLNDGAGVGDIQWEKHKDFERIIIDINQVIWDDDYKKGLPYEIPCPFEIAGEKYPCRIVVTVHGFMTSDAQFPVLNSKLIDYVHNIPYMEMGTIRFAVVLKKPIKYKVIELKNPARIVIEMIEDENTIDFPDVYSLRTGTIKEFETAGFIDEDLVNLGAENVRIIKTKNDGLCVEEGYYETEEQAEEVKTKYKDEGIELFVEKRGVCDIPQ